MRKAVVDKTGLVINAIEIEEGSKWQPPEGCYLLDEKISETANIGDTWDGTKIIKALKPTPSVVIDWQVQFDAASTALAKVKVLAKMQGLNA